MKHHHHEPPEHHHRRGGRRRRAFDHGELRLLILALIEQHPRHGYELMKAIEDQFAGTYSPSPGVIYPTLAWLDDMGYAAVSSSTGRKQYSITPEGTAFLLANRAAADHLLTRSPEDIATHAIPENIRDALRTLKHALRDRTDRSRTRRRDRIGDPDGQQDREGQSMTRHTSTAEIRSEKASGYLQQLCKHFEHKRPVTFDPHRGHIEFQDGSCDLSAEGDRLTMTVRASDPEGVARLEDVVERHLVRFAFREDLALNWTRSDG
jgi:DNA-binding PadR family transcriptional regulator